MTEYSLTEALHLRERHSEEVEQHRLELLRKHLAHAARAPYYKKLFEKNNIRPEELSTLDDLQAIPFTDRQELDGHGDLFQTVPDEQIVDLSLTSGTTGPPVKVPYTTGDLQRLAFNETMAFWGAGIRPDDTCLIAVTLDRCFIAGLAYYNGLVQLGARAIRSGPGQPARQWELISMLRPTVIVGVPTFLLQVAKWGVDHGHDPSRAGIRLLVTIGEPIRRPDFSLTPLGQTLTDAWKCSIRGSYGATELETGLTECGAEKGGHIHPELSIVEIIDDQGNVLPDGRRGEMVFTPLGVEGFPLIRFKTGDITRKYTEECSCGWKTARIGPIEGRVSQRLKVKGTTIYPETIFHVLQEIRQIDASYIEVRSAYDLSDEIRVVVGSRASITEKEIGALLQARLRVRPEVSILDTQEVHNVMFKEGGRKPKRFFDLRRGEEI
ncbi:MAG: AMP-binding protein [Desulfobulbaceae bacterium]|nr:AMP-binding protein [Desulfobulbaceae bacterium]